MGFADSRGDKSYNKELSAQRAEAVKNYLVKNGNIEAARISVEPMGEAAPVASNATAAGRQENRRVEIAVRTK
jgi:outer membrane protein OmpA-like peptidoglycan-associated protein